MFCLAEPSVPLPSAMLSLLLLRPLAHPAPTDDAASMGLRLKELQLQLKAQEEQLKVMGLRVQALTAERDLLRTSCDCGDATPSSERAGGVNVSYEHPRRELKAEPAVSAILRSANKTNASKATLTASSMRTLW